MSNYRQGFLDGFAIALDLKERGIELDFMDLPDVADLLMPQDPAETRENLRSFASRRSRQTKNKPKRKRKKSEYQIWAEKERPKIVKQHPRFDFGRVQKELGIRWRRKQRKGGKK